MSRLRRLRARVVEWATVTFLLPCPLCGERFAGFEWADVGGLPSTVRDPEYPDDPTRGVAICPTCTRTGRGRDQWIFVRVRAKIARLRARGTR